MQPSAAPAIQIVTQGTNSNGDNFFHALITNAEQDVTHILERVGNKAFLHKMVGAGQIVTQELNIPLLNAIMGMLSDITA